MSWKCRVNRNAKLDDRLDVNPFANVSVSYTEKFKRR